MSYKVYTAEYLAVGNHHMAIFVETGGDKKGRLYHAIGNVLQGMTYEARDSKNPANSVSFVQGTLNLIGTVKKEDMPRFEAACEEVEVPGAQLLLNGQLKDPSKPLRRCREWVQDAKAKLIADGILTV